MSAINVQKALKDFATTANSSSIVLKGEWGTGKTFIWNEVIKNYRQEFSHSNYSYVSLFGLASLTDLKRAIFTNIVKREKAGSVATADSIRENFKKLNLSDSSSWLRQVSGLTRDVKIPFIGGIGGIVDSVQFASISDTIICIDDFERKNKSLSARDVLGLISNLTESRKCSVILILNENSLEKNDEYFTFSEKVFDYEVAYRPEVRECIQIVFPPEDKDNSLLSSNINRLGINNIRLLKKIKLFNEMLKPHLKGAPREVYEKAMSTLPLAVFAGFGQNTCPVNIDFINNPIPPLSFLTSDTGLGEEQKEENSETIKKVRWLNDYGFKDADELDLAIVSLVRRGYADEDQFQMLLTTLKESIQHNKDMALLSDAWHAFNSSFSENYDEVITKFETALKVCIRKMNLRDIDSVCWLYESFNLHKRVYEIISEHFGIAETQKLYKSKRDIINWPTNKLLGLRLKQFIENQASDISIETLMDMANKDDGFSPEVLRAFQKRSPDEFYQYFKSCNHPFVIQYTRNCLDLCKTTFSDITSIDGARYVFLCTYEAIQLLASESAINKIRATRFENYADAYEKAHLE